QRYADLRALVADLERLQCRCGRSTWSRLTRSIFGSFKRSASCFRARRKSHDSSGSSALIEDEGWPNKVHHDAAEFNAGLAELDPGQPQNQNPYDDKPSVPLHLHNTWAQSRCPSDSIMAAGVNSCLATSIIAGQRGHPVASHESSFSSNSSGTLTDMTTITTPGEPVFAPHTTASPVELRESDASWHPHQFALQHSPQNPLTVQAEPPGSPAESLRGTVAWLPGEASAPVFELESATRLRKSVLPQTAQAVSDFPQSRQYSYDSETEAMVNASVDNQPSSTTFQSPSQKKQDAVPALQYQPSASPPASPPTRNKRRRRAKRSSGQQNNETLRCDLCDYVAGGKEPRRMMAKHCRTKGHCEKMGQEPPKYICPVCGSAQVREDNLRQHIIKKHEKKEPDFLRRDTLQNGDWERTLLGGIEAATRGLVYDPLGSELAGFSLSFGSSSGN
ncbi:hypothetical protein C7999DRAFT_14892, partial [Corynascus novoguineensis]